jgi:hypothetical protein
MEMIKYKMQVYFLGKIFFEGRLPANTLFTKFFLFTPQTISLCNTS